MGCNEYIFFSWMYLYLLPFSCIRKRIVFFLYLLLNIFPKKNRDKFKGKNSLSHYSNYGLIKYFGIYIKSKKSVLFRLKSAFRG